MVESTSVYIENQRRVNLTQNRVVDKRTEHIDTQNHFAREALHNSSILLQYYGARPVSKAVTRSESGEV